MKVIGEDARLLRGPGIDSCEVTTPGRDEKNGLGAIREIRAGASHFVEEVVRFEREEDTTDKEAPRRLELPKPQPGKKRNRERFERRIRPAPTGACTELRRSGQHYRG